MRIRKNAKLLSSLLFSPQEPPPPTHVCQLNQSPWDVIPFSSLPHYQQQLDGEDFTYAGNGSWVDPTAAASDSMAVTNDDIPKKREEISGGFSFNSNNNDNDDNDDSDDVSYGGAKVIRNLALKGGGGCRKSNGKGWHCTRAAREGHYFCDHHLNANNYSAANKAGPPGEVSGPPPRRPGRGRPPKKAQPQPQSAKNSNSNQFYYYSGFGPLWGKRRNERVAGGGWESLLAEAEEETTTAPTSPSSLQIDGDDMEHEDEDEDELSEDSSSSSTGGGGRKRTRKPVKARSLKSLM